MCSNVHTAMLKMQVLVEKAGDYLWTKDSRSSFSKEEFNTNFLGV